MFRDYVIGQFFHFLLHSLYIQFKNFSQNRFVLRYKALAVRHLDIERGTSLLELKKRLDKSIDIIYYICLILLPKRKLYQQLV